MKFDTHETDLYVLPESREESKRMTDYLNHVGLGWHYSRSNVKGQDWYGHEFIEIPFFADLRERLQTLADPA